MTVGKVILVGAGPGDPGLITVRGADALRWADVVIYDRLVNPTILDYTRADALRILTGKTPGAQDWSQAAINDLMILHARAGKCVVRLKGGDPFVFGRGSEEVRALEGVGIPVEVVSGVTSAVAVPACAGIPLTERSVASSFAVVTGHEAPDKGHANVHRRRLAKAVDTIVVLMGLATLPEIVEQLLAHGRSPETPVAIVSRGSTDRQEVVFGTLGNIVGRAEYAVSPATIVIGEVVRLSPDYPRSRAQLPHAWQIGNDDETNRREASGSL